MSRVNTETARKLREAESLQLRKKILQSKSKLGNSSDFREFIELLDNGEIFDHMKLATDAYSEKLQKLQSFKKANKSSTQSQNRNVDWMTENTNLIKSAYSTESELNSLLESLVMHSVGEEFSDSIVEEIEHLRKSRENDQKEAFNQWRDLKSLIIETTNKLRQISISPTKPANHPLPKGGTSSSSSSSSSTSTSPLLSVPPAWQTSVSILADLLLQARSNHYQSWREMSQEEEQLMRDVLRERAKLVSTQREERILDLNQQLFRDLSLDLSLDLNLHVHCKPPPLIRKRMNQKKEEGGEAEEEKEGEEQQNDDDDDDKDDKDDQDEEDSASLSSELILQMEEWVSKIHSLDNSHKHALQDLQLEREAFCLNLSSSHSLHVSSASSSSSSSSCLLPSSSNSSIKSNPSQQLATNSSPHPNPNPHPDHLHPTPSSTSTKNSQKTISRNRPSLLPKTKMTSTTTTTSTSTSISSQSSMDTQTEEKEAKINPHETDLLDSNSNLDSGLDSNSDSTVEFLPIDPEDMYGGWSPQNHELFSKIYRHYLSSHQDRKKLTDTLQTQLPPDLSLSEIRRHEEWFRFVRTIANKKKVLQLEYDRTREILVNEAREQMKIFKQELIESKERERRMREHEKQREQVHRRLEEQRQVHDTLCQEMREQEARDKEQAQKKAESIAEKEQREAEEKRKRVEAFKKAKEELFAKQEEIEKERQKNLEEERKQEIELNRGNVERREQLRIEREQERLRKEEIQAKEEERRLEVLSKLAQQVPYWEDIQNVSHKLDHITTAVRSHQYTYYYDQQDNQGEGNSTILDGLGLGGEGEGVCIGEDGTEIGGGTGRGMGGRRMVGGMEESQFRLKKERGHIPMRGFNDKTIVKDARFRLASALREAGLQHSEAAREMIGRFHPRPHLAIHGIL